MQRAVHGEKTGDEIMNDDATRHDDAAEREGGEENRFPGLVAGPGGTAA
jgi:hypothetical protein